MTKTDILDFLELPNQASDNEIKSRLADKWVYFSRLHQTAPNEVLRRLHTQSKEKIKAIQQQLGLQISDNANQQHGDVHVVTPSLNNHSSAQAATPVCWLIRHTENQPAKSFPVYPGNNVIGRNAQPGKQCIAIEDDTYLSRVHALLYAHTGMMGFEFVIDDSASANESKPSKNGTYINGNTERITKKVKLSEGDTIQVGITKLVLKLNKEPIHKIVHEVEESEFIKTVVINIF